jgi:soluble lytic murein transglycosylase-like protein
MKLLALFLFSFRGFIPAPELPPLPHILTPAPPPLTRADIGVLINIEARRHNLAPAFVKSIVAAESAFHPEAVSAKGAVGLMQVMPQTALEMGLDATVPEENVEAGTRYLAWLVARYGRSRDWLCRAIAAYNAGPGNVDKYGGVPPFQETRAYVARVLAYFKSYRGKAFASARLRLSGRHL